MKVARIKQIADYLAHPSKTIELFGMYDADNLGDEAMKIAGLHGLPPKRAAAVIGAGNPFLKAMIRGRRFRDEAVGGGTLIHGGGKDGANSWLDHIALRQRQGARVTFLGTGISFRENQIVESSDSVRRWTEIMRKAAYVGLRGPLSVAVAARLGVEASVFGDAAFLLYDPALVRAQDRIPPGREPLFGINVGEVLKGSEQAAFEASFAKLTAHLSARFKIRIFVVNPEDYDASIRVIERSGIASDRYEIVRNYRDATGFMRQSAECEGFIGIRLHASGLAMVAGVPALLVAYLPKCVDFALPIGMEHALMELPLDDQQLIASADDVVARPDHYRRPDAIAAISSAQHETIARLFGAPGPVS
jgi:polysaccharide pyruvyl transferase WcaK-like protein